MDNNVYLKKRKLMFFLILVIPFLVLPIKNILIQTYAWHIKQPETWQGAIEILILLSIILISLNSNIKIKSYLFWVSIILYLCNNGVIIPVSIVYFYVEVIKHIGKALLKVINAKFEGNIHTINFVCGMIFTSFIMIILSMFKLGTIYKLTLGTVILFSISLIVENKLDLMVSDLNTFIKSKDKVINIFLTIIVGVILVVCAKSNSAIDYDSIWYGLRSEYVLFGENSFFDNLGLVSFVYYYPKLMELFYAPISGMGDYSFIYSMNIMMLILTLIEVSDFLSDLKVNKTYKWLILCVIATIPTIANMSTTAKTDIFTVFLMLMCYKNIFNFFLSNRMENLILGLTCAITSYGGKQTSLLFTTILMLSSLCIYIYICIKKKSIDLKIKGYKKHCIILIISIMVLGGISLRTYVLTGVPIYRVGLNILTKLGFTTNYPFPMQETSSIVNGGNLVLKDYLIRIYQVFFNPKALGHIVMLWVGNIYIYFTVILLFLRKTINLDKKAKYMLLLSSPILLVSIVYLLILSTPDANYFIFAIILTCIMVYYLLSQIKQTNFQKYVVVVSLIFIISNSSILFVSHPSWSWGTKAFGFNLFKDNFETEQVNMNNFTYNGVGEIYSYLKEHNIRVIGNGTEQLLHKLPVRFENVEGIRSSHLGNSDIFMSYENFKEYIIWAEIKGFIINNQTAHEDAYYIYLQQLKQEFEFIEINDAEYSLIVIN